MRLFIKEKLVRLMCRTGLQTLMNKIHLFSLTAMNYGNANVLGYELTGEKKAIEYVVKNNAQQEFIFFDVGANAGNYSISVLQILANRNAKIYAFEPSKFSFPQLVKNTASFQNIQCFNFGLGKQEEAVTLYANYEGSGATTLYNSGISRFNFNKNLSEEIYIYTLDNFCKNKAIDKIDFLKIDVEGHELFVLEGGARMLAKNKIKFIQFEFGPFHVYSRTFFKDFWNMLSPNYNLYRIISNGIFEIKSYSENLEVFRTANFLAELKSL